MIKCPLNLGRFSKSLLNLPRFTGHLITNIPQSMRLLIIKIVNIVGLMNLAVVMRDVQVCVVDLVLEIDVKIMKIAHQVNIVLESISKCVATTGNVDLRHATQKRKLKVKLVGELQLA